MSIRTLRGDLLYAVGRSRVWNKQVPTPWALNAQALGIR